MKFPVGIFIYRFGLWEPHKEQPGERGYRILYYWWCLQKIANCPGSALKCSSVACRGSSTKQPFLIYHFKNEGASNCLVFPSYPATSWWVHSQLIRVREWRVIAAPSRVGLNPFAVDLFLECVSPEVFGALVFQSLGGALSVWTLNGHVTLIVVFGTWLSCGLLFVFLILVLCSLYDSSSSLIYSVVKARPCLLFGSSSFP